MAIRSLKKKKHNYVPQYLFDNHWPSNPWPWGETLDNILKMGKNLERGMEEEKKRRKKDSQKRKEKEEERGDTYNLVSL